MRPQPEAHSWFAPIAPDPALERRSAQPREIVRLWRGFMTARLTLALVLLLLQGAIYVLGSSSDRTLIFICGGYLVATLITRVRAGGGPLGKTFDARWLAILGVDLAVFTALQVIQDGSINYTPLFALPILMASVLGSLLLAMTAAAGVTLLLFGHAIWLSVALPSNTAAHFYQAALTGAGGFILSFLASQMATRLESEERRAQRSQLAEKVQRQVNELVIESLTDGIVVVDQNGMVRAANPAARMLLGAERDFRVGSFDLTHVTGWQGLVDLMRLSFSLSLAQQADVTIHHVGQGPRRIHAHTQLTSSQSGSEEVLCVMFLQDQREVEARMRADKLASMGRMSAAVAHEIRNPLAAIAQANALLDEELTEPRHKQLTRMVQQNSQRLGKIVDDVLDISRVRSHDDQLMHRGTLNLCTATDAICHDWQAQSDAGHLLQFKQGSHNIVVNFETEHLRRVLVNLLDNAGRYASARIDCIQVEVTATPLGQSHLLVWSDGPPMDKSVERHLFEPFFSSESRSSGLGLYICRELCEEHGASIAYERRERRARGQTVSGNEFIITFPSLRSQDIPIAINEPQTPTPWHRTRP